ncbi:MAG: MFS transporter [Alphaproteobacteria bacterium]|nr:MFS transporter [Alphaproteobacteria bacterium]
MTLASIASPATQTKKTATERLPTATILALAQFALPLAVAYLPLNLYLTRYYGGDLKIDIATVGIVLVAARIFDFIVDPLLGALSDRFGHAQGRRRLWTLIAVPITMAGVYMTFIPPADAGPVYLLFALFLVYFGWTMGTIAYGAWGAEISGDYAERTRITGVRQMFALVGILIASLAPLFTGGGPGSPNGFAPLMSGLAWIALALMPLSALILVLLVPEPKSVAHGIVSWSKGLKVAASNGPFMRLLAANLFGGIGAAANLAVVIWFFEKALDLGTLSGIPLIIYLLASIFGAPLWIWAGHKIAKHNALIIASLSGIAVFAILFFLPKGQFALTNIIMALAGLTGSASATLGASIAADVIDLDALRSREARAGLLLAFWGMAQKAADALGVGLGLMILWFFGFNQNGANDETAVLGLKLAYIAVPIAFSLLSISMLWRFPITPERQRRIRAILERRAEREAVV